MMLWWDWLLSSTADLKLRGHDPDKRVVYTGHKRALSPIWARTIGMWCRTDPTDIMHCIAPNAGSDERSAVRSRYDVFRHRHKLCLRREFIKRMKMDPQAFIEIGPVVVATEAYRRMKEHLDRSPGLSPGAAAEHAVLYTGWMMDLPRSERSLIGKMGLLPIEMVLYYYAIAHILEETLIDHDQWMSGYGSEEGNRERARFWKRYGCNAMVRLPETARDRYPVDHEENDQA